MKVDALTAIVITLIFAVISAYVATQKNKNPYVAFFFGLFFGLLGLLAVYFLLPEQQAVVTEEKKEQKKLIPLPLPEVSCWYYLDSEKKAQGPLMPSEIKKLNLSLQTYIWKEGMSDWKRMSELPEWL